MLAADSAALAAVTGSRRKQTKRHWERPVQKGIVDFHRLAVANPLEAILFAVPNGELRDAVTAAILSGRPKRHPDMPPETDAELMTPYGQGQLPGAPDLVLALAGGKLVFIETKIPKIAGLHEAGRQSREQKVFQRAVEALGHEYRLLHGPEEYETLLREKGVRLRISRSIWPHPAPPVPPVRTAVDPGVPRTPRPAKVR